MSIPYGTVIGPSVQRYGCVKCQKHHYSPEPIFREHLPWQSKHGYEYVPASEWEAVQKRAKTEAQS